MRENQTNRVQLYLLREPTARSAAKQHEGTNEYEYNQYPGENQNRKVQPHHLREPRGVIATITHERTKLKEYNHVARENQADGV